MTEHGPVTALPEDECWHMLREQEFGRLAFHLLDEVHIVPINYAVDDHDQLVFRTAEGSKLLGLTINDDVAFEIDEYTEEAARSVVVRGRAHQLEGRDADETDVLPLRPWVDTAKFNVVAIEADQVTGRRFELTRPWLHMKPQPEDED
ncbi:MAG TPA: pyridoxamine 5'-phosphate oxidase family protein [Dermatophilaceae bacterium]|nr:pyridoxamine 5'-phosphate oxidase family protein [Dermatophilaceae bacterium]